MRYREWWAGLQCRGHIGRLHLLERTCNETLRSEAVTRLDMINDEQRMYGPCMNALMQMLLACSQLTDSPRQTHE